MYNLNSYKKFAEKIWKIVVLRRLLITKSGVNFITQGHLKANTSKYHT